MLSHYGYIYKVELVLICGYNIVRGFEASTAAAAFSSELFNTFEDNVCDPTIVYDGNDDLNDEDLGKIVEEINNIQKFNAGQHEIRVEFGAKHLAALIRQISDAGIIIY